MEAFELTFDMNEPPFKADSISAMEYSILGFCKAKDSSPTLEKVSETQIKVYVDEKQSEKAVRHFEKAAECCEQGRFETARSSLQKAIKAWPFYSEAYRLCAQSLFNQEQLDKAVDANLDALRFDPKNLWALILMGNIFAAKDKPEVADTYYSKVLEFHPENALALNNLGGIYCKRKDYARGAEFFEKALAIEGGYICAYYGLALARYNQGKYTECFDQCLKGLKLGNERPEDAPMRPHLAQLAADAAEILEQDNDLLEEVKRIAKEIEQKYNTTIKFVEDSSLKVLAHMEFADHHHRDYHVVRYREGAHYAHLTLHELMHLVMMQEAKAEGKLETIGFAQENFDLFLERHEKVLDRLRDEIDAQTADGLAKQLFNGISIQMMSVPLDLFVETKIFNEYPKFHAAQFASLWSMEQNNLKSVESAANVPYFPQETKDVNKLLNMVQSLFMQKNFGAGNFESYQASSFARQKALDMYSRFEEMLSSFSAGDEYTLFKEFARQENILEYFRITEQTGKPQENGFKTKVEQNQEAFEKTHEKDDPIVNAMMSEYMLGAMLAFDEMTPEEISAVARDCAFKGMNGIQPGTDAKYTLNAFPGKQFTGYEFLAYFYVSWAIAEPDQVLELGLPFHKAYALAKQMYEKRRG